MENRNERNHNRTKMNDSKRGNIVNTMDLISFAVSGRKKSNVDIQIENKEDSKIRITKHGKIANNGN